MGSKLGLHSCGPWTVALQLAHGILPDQVLNPRLVDSLPLSHQGSPVYAFLKYVKLKVVQSCLTLLRPHELYSPWNSPGQNTGVGNLSLLQGIFPIQGLNPGFPHPRWILYQLSHQGSSQLRLIIFILFYFILLLENYFLTKLLF